MSAPATDWVRVLNPDPIIATFTFYECSCRFDIRKSDLPLAAMVCKHGNSIVGSELENLDGNVIVGADND